MSTAELTGTRAGLPGERPEELRERAGSTLGLPLALAGALLGFACPCRPTPPWASSCSQPSPAGPA